jgi:hypothetical protein
MAAMGKADPHEVRDSLVADLVAASLAKTGETNASDAVELVVPILEGMEHKYQRTQTRANPQEQLQDEAERQGIKGSVERFTPEHVITPQQAQSQADRLLRERVRWMKSKPEYNSKIQMIWTRLKFKAVTPAQAESQFWALVDQADAQLKRPWHKDPRRIQVGG